MGAFEAVLPTVGRRRTQEGGGWNYRHNEQASALSLAFLRLMVVYAPHDTRDNGV